MLKPLKDLAIGWPPPERDASPNTILHKPSTHCKTCSADKLATNQAATQFQNGIGATIQHSHNYHQTCCSTVNDQCR
jgi:hypothetical protein